MRSVTALEVRQKFGEIVDSAAAGERIVIERAGQPVAAIVSLADLARVDPDRRKADALGALDELRRINRGRELPRGFDVVAEIHTARARQDAKATAALRQRSTRQPG
jgi:prevent-host-death family protein